MHADKKVEDDVREVGKAIDVLSKNKFQVLSNGNNGEGGECE